MIHSIKSLFITWGISQHLSSVLANGTAVIGVLFLAFLSNLIAGRIIIRILRVVIKRTKTRWDDVLLEEGVFDRLSHIVPALIIYGFSELFTWQVILQRLALSYMVFIGILVFNSLLSAAEDIYSSYKVSKEKPIRGYIQIIKVFLFIVGMIIVIGIIIDRSPWKLLTGIGAMTAVLLLVFKDSILGLVASTQLAANDMVKIGDWIEVEKYGANGEVIEISLTTVKVRNWDKTISNIPTYALISDSFKNWRGMTESGGRRIKRSIFIDMTSIAFCNDEMLDRFRRIHLLTSYIERKVQEIDEHTVKHNIDTSIPVNGRRLTNIGTFRAYLDAYVRNHPNVHEGMTIMVRHLPPSPYGIPIEIYVFSNDIQWEHYEGIQADIFDHILAVIPEFGLRVFQNPTGSDLQMLKQT
jgi:miniconductance mechanosensitive channel